MIAIITENETNTGLVISTLNPMPRCRDIQNHTYYEDRNDILDLLFISNNIFLGQLERIVFSQEGMDCFLRCGNKTGDLQDKYDVMPPLERSPVEPLIFQSELFNAEWKAIQNKQRHRDIAVQWFESLSVKASSYTNRNKDLKLNDDNYRKLANGKRTSIRLGKKDINLGPIRIVNCETTELYADTIVTGVRFCSFDSLTQPDAYLDGSKDISELRAELKRCYNRDICNTDVVTVIDFDVVD